ncbi:MAG: hypothetical protein ACXABY_24880 [Candidatus Thorarchaeota archaeon]|jgi:hypothetical protein
MCVVCDQIRKDPFTLVKVPLTLLKAHINELVTLLVGVKLLALKAEILPQASKKVQEETLATFEEQLLKVYNLLDRESSAMLGLMIDKLDTQGLDWDWKKEKPSIIKEAIKMMAVPPSDESDDFFFPGDPRNN